MTILVVWTPLKIDLSRDMKWIKSNSWFSNKPDPWSPIVRFRLRKAAFISLPFFILNSHYLIAAWPRPGKLCCGGETAPTKRAFTSFLFGVEQSDGIPTRGGWLAILSTPHWSWPKSLRWMGVMWKGFPPNTSHLAERHKNSLMKNNNIKFHHLQCTRIKICKLSLTNNANFLTKTFHERKWI